MMKKISLIGLIIIVGMLPIFAGVNKINCIMFGAWSEGNVSLPSNVEISKKSNAIGLMLQGTIFFSRIDGQPVSDIGFSTKLGVSTNMTASVDGILPDAEENSLIWEIGIGGAYQINPLPDMLIEMGAGLNYSSPSETFSGETTTYKIFSIGAYGEIDYAFSTDFFLSFGISISYPLGGIANVSKGGKTISSGPFKSSVFTFAPYFGFIAAF